MEHDEDTIGVYLWGKERREAGLVGHLPTEISKLMRQFLDADKNNLLMATVVGTPSHRDIKTHEAVSRCRQKQPPDGNHCRKKKKRTWTCHHC